MDILFVKLQIQYLLFFLLVLSSCSSVAPVRSRLFETRAETPKERTEPEIAPARPARPSQRFGDTLPVSRNTSVPPSLIAEFEAAVALFDQQKTDRACAKFQELLRKVHQGDSLYFEIRFKISECAAYNARYEEAGRIIDEMIDNPQLPNNILEKSLVWLGQIYCSMNRNAEATMMFLRLKKEFPRSEYIQVARCDAVK